MEPNVRGDAFYGKFSATERRISGGCLGFDSWQNHWARQIVGEGKAESSPTLTSWMRLTGRGKAQQVEPAPVKGFFDDAEI